MWRGKAAEEYGQNTLEYFHENSLMKLSIMYNECMKG